MLQAETFLELIRNKPQRKISDLDVMVLLLYDIKICLEAQTELLKTIAQEQDSSGEPGNESLRWWQRIFR